jgi:hypothetical protein
MTTITIPVSLRQRIKLLALMEEMSMIAFIDKMVQKSEKARGIGRQTSTPELSPVKEMNNT